MQIQACTIECAVQTNLSAVLPIWITEEKDTGEDSSTLFSNKKKRVLSKVIFAYSYS